MVVIKVVYTPCGEHVRCKLFVAPSMDETFAHAGDIVLRNDEFLQWKRGKNAYVFTEL